MSEKGQDLNFLESKTLLILEKHQGKENAISGPDFAEKLKVNTRRVRKLITHLLEVHRIPSASSAGKPHGYFIPVTKEEVEEFYNTFRKRGLTGLKKAAWLEKTTVAEMGIQITIDEYLDRDNQKIPGVAEAATKLLRIFRKNPKLYAKEIEAISEEARPLLVDSAKMKEINEAAAAQETAARRLKELTSMTL